MPLPTHIIELLDSSKLNTYLTTCDLAFDRVVSIIRDEIKDFPGKVKRWHSPDYDQHLKLILLNLYCAHIKNPKWFVSYDRNKNRYSIPGRYTGAALSHGTMVSLIDDLEMLGYCEDVRGIYFSTAKYTSRMRATPKLMSLHNHELSAATVRITDGKEESETIILRTKKEKGKVRKLLDYNETAETIQMRMNLRKINEVNDAHFVGLHVLDEVLHEMILKMVVEEEQHKALKGNFETVLSG